MQLPHDFLLHHLKMWFDVNVSRVAILPSWTQGSSSILRGGILGIRCLIRSCTAGMTSVTDSGKPLILKLYLLDLFSRSSIRERAVSSWFCRTWMFSGDSDVKFIFYGLNPGSQVMEICFNVPCDFSCDLGQALFKQVQESVKIGPQN